MKKTFGYYKKQVEKFLKVFSSTLHQKETSIWNEKLAKTSADVHAFLRLRNVRNVTKKDWKVQSCFECNNKLDSVLLMLSTLLHLVKTDQAKGNDMKTPKVQKEIFEAPAEQEVAKVTIDVAKHSVEDERSCNEASIASEIFDAPADEKATKATVDEAEKSLEGEASNDEVAAAATLAAFEAPKKDGELSTASVDNDVNLHGIKVTWAVCPQLRHFPVSKCRRRCEWDVMARRAVNPFYQDVKPVEKPVEKDSDEYKQRIKKASSNFLASSCVVLNKSYPIGSDPYWNLTKAGQSKAQYEAEEPVRENEEGATQPIVPDGYNKFGFKIPK